GVPGTIIIGTAVAESGGGADSGGAADSGGGAGDTGSGSAIVVGGTPTAVAGSQTGALPQTGLETWIIALVGVLLVAVLFAAHRLRTN
ncbi:MAG TPA: LPXTG cell wall anchor domain-containing protein, partial [Chloroflexota bacterium]|nr:LPXTG cell wall anchor domain-containing protein [Chloroflexota bacterium]